MTNINNNTLPKILLATTNSGKLRELRALLTSLPAELLEPNQLGLHLHVAETGATYAENALIKALAYQEASGMPVLADDTGLEVKLLDGAPGVHSARFVDQPGASDKDRRMKLLHQLAGFPKPWLACFRCVVAVADPGGEIRLFDGEVKGEIINEERGDHGFGYDRLFYIPTANKTLAELNLEEKNNFSHRAAAVKKALPYLLSILSGETPGM
jgi:XTP/dITP diphosphohydrolase